MFPKRGDLRKGKVFPIYTDFKNLEGFIGNARLIRYEKSKTKEELPYLRIEIGGTDKQEPNRVNWCYQRWLVEFVDGPMKGHKTHRHIAHFHSISNKIAAGPHSYRNHVDDREWDIYD